MKKTDAYVQENNCRRGELGREVGEGGDVAGWREVGEERWE